LEKIDVKREIIGENFGKKGDVEEKWHEKILKKKKKRRENR
jgi:hypothetical protein